MIGSLREFCLRHQVHFEEEPQRLHSSRNTWLIRDILGKQWVVKSKEPAEATPELLKSLSVLHPPFHYPEPVSEPDAPYLMYPFLQGRLLAEEGFEDPETIEKVMDLIGRVQATMRSLVLVPHYQETLKLKDRSPLENPLEGLSFDRTQGTTEQQRAARHREMAESYHWTERNLDVCWNALQAHGLWAGAPFDEYRERVNGLFALHIPVVGSNLSHAALHPQHVIGCPDGQLGIVGWRIESRPRFYMIHTYLAWGFLRSERADACEFYRSYLARNSRRAFHTEHHLVFALCLMEQLAHWCEREPAEPLVNAAQKIEEASGLFAECVAKTRKSDDPF